ncbi:MAG: ATP-binding cassette domain-containing protein [Lachnospiraceae bacterium]|nr:ATP-binding cassette domain-containing protein [Lachnospiraceae bacterium]MDY2698646.1 ATP-binding cassette domain-containing protein [Lachnospiraceae bacterium]MDY4095149.1 ATP-binding cassette domain-containing protein [Lachnospiraceae bacterium]
MADKNGIIVANVTKEFGDQVVLKTVDAKFEMGKIYGIVGRNGSGKTVLLKCICGLLYPSTGTVTVNGRVVGKEVDYPENIGFIIESPGFLPRYSGLKNLKYLASIRGKIKEDEIRKHMELVGLNPDDKKHVGNYSLGMKQRLGIAQALMENPDILILDEPMNALDNNGVEDIRKVLLKMKDKGKLIIIASHVRDDIDILCDEVYGIEVGIMKKIR